jgi:hypothetical protein
MLSILGSPTHRRSPCRRRRRRPADRRLMISAKCRQIRTAFPAPQGRVRARRQESCRPVRHSSRVKVTQLLINSDYRVRCRLAAGGRWIRTFGSRPRPILLSPLLCLPRCLGRIGAPERGVAVSFVSYERQAFSWSRVHTGWSGLLHPTTDCWIQINPRILPLHCVHRSDRRRKD